MQNRKTYYRLLVLSLCVLPVLLIHAANPYAPVFGRTTDQVPGESTAMAPPGSFNQQQQLQAENSLLRRKIDTQQAYIVQLEAANAALQKDNDALRKAHP